METSRTGWIPPKAKDLSYLIVIDKHWTGSTLTTDTEKSYWMIIESAKMTPHHFVLSWLALSCMICTSTFCREWHVKGLRNQQLSLLIFFCRLHQALQQYLTILLQALDPEPSSDFSEACEWRHPDRILGIVSWLHRSPGRSMKQLSDCNCSPSMWKPRGSIMQQLIMWEARVMCHAKLHKIWYLVFDWS